MLLAGALPEFDPMGDVGGGLVRPPVIQHQAPFGVETGRRQRLASTMADLMTQ